MIVSTLFGEMRIPSLCICTTGLFLAQVFGSTALNWPADSALPHFPDIGDAIDAADITALTGEERVLLTTLQGIVNRQQPRIYLHWNKTDEANDGSNQAWLRDIAEYVHVDDCSGHPFGILERYRSEIAGAIVYDPDVVDTVNLATTVAGLRGAVVATAELAYQHQLPILEDFRGRFDKKYDVYNYALEHIYPLLTKRAITALTPEETRTIPGVPWSNLTSEKNRTVDASNNATYTVDLTPFLVQLHEDGTVYVRIKDAFEDDGHGAAVSHVLALADDQVLADFTPGTAGEDPFLVDWGGSYLHDYPWGWRSADGGAHIVYGFRPPNGTRSLTVNLTMANQFDVAATTTLPAVKVLNAVFRDYITAIAAPCIWLDPNNPDELPLLNRILESFDANSAYLGWFPNGDEMSGVTRTAANSMFVVAADYFFNGSLMSGLRSLFSTTTQNRKLPPPPAIEITKSSIPNKIYLSLTWTEGDNIQYMQHRMRVIWDDPARGQIPMGWTVSPILQDVAPNMLHYFQSTATSNDTFVTGPDGVGYTFPSNWPESDFELFLDMTARYTKSIGTASNIWVYNRINATLFPLANETIEAYHRALGPDLLGISADGHASGYGINVTSSDSGSVPVAGLATISSVKQGMERLQNISTQMYDGTKPVFVVCALYAWDTTPGNITQLVGQLGDEFEILGPEEHFRLFMEAQGIAL